MFLSMLTTTFCLIGEGAGRSRHKSLEKMLYSRRLCPLQYLEVTQLAWQENTSYDLCEPFFTSVEKNP